MQLSLCLWSASHCIDDLPADERHRGRVPVVHPRAAGADRPVQREEPSGADGAAKAPQGARTGAGEASADVKNPAGRGTELPSQPRLNRITTYLNAETGERGQIHTSISHSRPPVHTADEELLFKLTQFHSLPFTILCLFRNVIT